MNKTEFSRIIDINESTLNKKIINQATKEELTKLSARFELENIRNLSIECIISEKSDIKGAYLCTTHIKSEIVKFFIESTEETLLIDENFDTIFISEELAKENEENLREYDIEILTENFRVDIGEIAAQHLSLCVFM